MISYFIQVSFSWIIFYLVYHYFLRKETFFTINRYYLLGTLLFSLFVPIIGTWLKYLTAADPADVGEIFYVISEAPVVIDAAMTETSQSNAILILLLLVYLTGCLLAAIRFFIGLHRIYRLAKHGDQVNRGSYVLVHTDQSHLPFSFLNLVFVSKKIPLPDRIHHIIAHELCHIKKWHTVDILFTEIIHVFFWFNPILNYYKKALRQTHEFDADAAASDLQNMQHYQNLLMETAQSGMELRMTHQFFNAELKNRLTMLIQKKSPRTALGKYLLLVPILALALFLFSNSAIGPDNPLKKQILTAIENADAAPHLMNTATEIIQRYQEETKATESEINEILSEVGWETGIRLEWIYNRRVHLSFKEKIAASKGKLDLVHKLKSFSPPIYQKLEPTIKQFKGNFPLLNLNGHLVAGHWMNLDVDRVISHSYVPPKEAKEKYGDIAFGGVINIELRDFDINDLGSKGVIIEAGDSRLTTRKGAKKVDVLPRFPGCEDINGTEADRCAMERFNEYIADNLQYPKIARDHGVEGTVVVQFEVDARGRIGKVAIVRDIGAGCGDEAKYLIQNMNNLVDKWQPAIKDGDPAVYTLKVPVLFKLDGLISKKPFSARDEAYLNGAIEKSFREAVEDPQIAKDAVALLEDFEWHPRPLFIVDGQVVAKDSIKLQQDEIFKVTLIDEEQAAELYDAVNQKAVVISTYSTPQEQQLDKFYTKYQDLLKKSPDRGGVDLAEEKSDKIDFAPKSEKPFLTSLVTFPNPARYKLHLSFTAEPGPLTIAVHDVQGKLLLEKQISDFSGHYLGILESKSFIAREAFLSITQGKKRTTKIIIFSE